MMIDERLARVRTLRNNIERYRRLLQTRLTELEREFIEKRLAEEQSNLESVGASTFPVTFEVPRSADRLSGAA